jgi:hypothetical protein
MTNRNRTAVLLTLKRARRRKRLKLNKGSALLPGQMWWLSPPIKRERTERRKLIRLLRGHDMMA